MLFLAYPKCSTCQKAKKFLDDRGLTYEERDIKADHPTYEELAHWHKVSGYPVKKFFNTSGLLYKSMNLKEKLPDLSDDEALRLLASDGMLVKRPILISGSTVLLGFRESEWDVLK
ncbi:MAG: arsenate reductase family protein [Eubacteriales bacterium]